MTIPKPKPHPRRGTHMAFTASQAVARHALDVEPDASRRLLDSVRQIVRAQVMAAVADVYPVTITTREDGERLIVEASAPNLVAENAWLREKLDLANQMVELLAAVAQDRELEDELRAFREAYPGLRSRMVTAEARVAELEAAIHRVIRANRGLGLVGVAVGHNKEVWEREWEDAISELEDVGREAPTRKDTP